MSQEIRAEAAWDRIEAWLRANLPAALGNLRAPATGGQLDRISAALGRPLPPGLRALLRMHDGGRDGSVASAFPDGHWFLPCAQMAEAWERQASLSERMGGPEDAFDFWKAQVEDGIIFIQGPVKPHPGSRDWIPFSTLEGHVQRFVDFDPAPGGTEGQVIEVDPEGCVHRVLAPSFADFLEAYADALERGEFTTGADGIRSRDDGMPNPTDWELPAYLAEVTFQTASPDPWAEALSPERMDPDDEVVLEGAMGTLCGGPETIFSLKTSGGREHTFLAKPGLTRGYRTIAVRQGARVRARRYTAETDSYFVDQAGSDPPDFVALEYTMLRSSDT